MKTWTRIAGVLLLTAVVFAQDPYTLKLDVPVVSVDVTVVDSNQNLVNHLTQADFLIVENGRAQSIQFFSPVSAPYNVFLLFDSSGSTRGNREFMQKAAKALLENLRSQDRIALGSFDDNFRVNSRWSSDRAQTANALRELIRRTD